MLEARLAAIGDSFETCTWYRDHWTRDRNILRAARGGTHDLDALDRILGEHFPKNPKAKG